MADHAPANDLTALLRATTERPLEPEEFALLESLLLEDADARAQYQQYMRIDAMLQWQLGSAMDSRSITLTDTSHNPLPPAPSNAATPRSHTGPRRLLGNMAATMAITIVFWGVFFLFFMMRPKLAEMAQEPVVPPARSPRPVVAELVGAFDVVWAADASLRPAKGTQLRQGNKLELTAGLVQLRFESGAEVTLEGPVAFVTSDTNTASLESGRLLAQASEAAVGFCVETPSATVTDLGTVFGVIVDGDGSTEVHVFSGLVEAAASRSFGQSPSGVPVVLEEGKAARFSVGQKNCEMLAAKEAAFVRLQQPVDNLPTIPPSGDETPQVVLAGPVGHDLTDPEDDGQLTGTISGGGENAPGESYRCAFDDDLQTKWLAFRPMGSHIIFRFADGQQHVVKSYTITAANDAPVRDPYCWWLSGSHDGKHFTPLHGGTVKSLDPSDLAESPWQRFETRAFAVPQNDQAFEYYRFDFRTAFGAGTPYAAELEIPNSIQVGEIELFDVDVSKQQPSVENPK